MAVVVGLRFYCTVLPLIANLTVCLVGCLDGRQRGLRQASSVGRLTWLGLPALTWVFRGLVVARQTECGVSDRRTDGSAAVGLSEPFGRWPRFVKYNGVHPTGSEKDATGQSEDCFGWRHWTIHAAFRHAQRPVRYGGFKLGS